MEELGTSSKKSKLRILIGLFIGLLVLCTFAGNTLRNRSLPKVYVITAGAGTIVHAYESNATIQPVGLTPIENPSGWKVAEIYVKAGDLVTRGQPLIRYDDEEAKLQLQEMYATLKKQQLSMSLLEYNYKEADRNGDELQKASARVAIESAKLDMASQERSIRQQEKSIAHNRQSNAPVDGIVAQLHAVVGTAAGGSPELVLVDSAQGFEIRCQVPGDMAANLEIGNTVDHISLSGQSDRMLSGTITSIKDALVEGSFAPAHSDSSSRTFNSSPSEVTIAIKDTGLQGGERVTVKLSEANFKELITVPNEAVHHDERGDYVFTLSTDNGPLGNVYRVVETPVTIADANAYVTGIAEGLFREQEIVLHSTSSFLMDGIRVRR